MRRTAEWANGEALFRSLYAGHIDKPDTAYDTHTSGDPALFLLKLMQP